MLTRFFVLINWYSVLTNRKWMIIGCNNTKKWNQDVMFVSPQMNVATFGSSNTRLKAVFDVCGCSIPLLWKIRKIPISLSKRSFLLQPHVEMVLPWIILKALFIKNDSTSDFRTMVSFNLWFGPTSSLYMVQRLNQCLHRLHSVSWCNGPWAMRLVSGLR